MHPDVESLLVLQTEDQAIGEMEARLAALEPRLREMEHVHASAVDALSRAQAAVEAEEKSQRELQNRIAQHKQLHERNIAQLDTVRRMKEATAAMSQVEQARRIGGRRERAPGHRTAAGRAARISRIASAGTRHARGAARGRTDDNRARAIGSGCRVGGAPGESSGLGGASRAHPAAEVRSDPLGAAGRRHLSVARTIVRALRHERSDAASEPDGGSGHDRGLRDVRGPHVRGNLMV